MSRRGAKNTRCIIIGDNRKWFNFFAPCTATVTTIDRFTMDIHNRLNSIFARVKPNKSISFVCLDPNFLNFTKLLKMGHDVRVCCIWCKISTINCRVCRRTTINNFFII
eukprot:Pompholyxophrys_punicea_v1_NODE_1877_length_521_cov_3.768240.p2 type:complete len:109 gc:universal NODE_1877_length_521_cov_3.768240:415-89(-)